MEVDIEEDENEPELTYPYEETDSLNPLPPASESEPDNEIEVENPIKHKDEAIPVSVYETAHALVEKKGEAKDRFYGKLILDLGNEVRSSVEQGTAAIERLVEKLENVEEKAECKKLTKELEEASVDVAIAAERARQANVRNNASGSRPAMGRDTTPTIRECTFAGYMKCNPTAFRGVKGAVELRRWFEKTESVFEISECVEGKKVKFSAATLEGPGLTWWKTKVATMGLETVNQMPWTEMKQLMTAEFCPIEEIQRMEHELWNLKIKEYDIKSQDRNERILEGKKRKWENLQGGNSSGKGNQKDNPRQTLQNNQKQGNARAMVTAPTDGKVPLCERCFTRHVGQCTIKCHKYGKVGHKERHYREKSVATGANAQPIWTCYDCGEQGEQGHKTGNRYPKKVKQEVVGEVRG
ncbi:hypothetical protein Tco_0368171 [Tanacetum coccineum]